MGNFFRRAAIYYLLGVVFFGWGFASAVFQFFPYPQLKATIAEIKAFFDGSLHKDVKDIVQLDHQESRSEFNFSGLKITDKSFQDNGYFLLSRYSKQHGQTIVELFDISANKAVHTWVPDLGAIFKMTPKNADGVNTKMAYRSQHPLLMDNGDLLIGSGEGPLARIDRCGKPVWAIDRHFHHSIELDAAGNIVAPTVLAGDTKKANLDVREEGFAIISGQGKILAEYSAHDLLVENGYRGLVYGVGVFETDRYHLNDAQPLRGKVAADGVLLSIRNLSTVARFTPATGKIEWLQTGPWLNQHDVSELGDGQYAVFGNNLVRGPEKIIGDGHSEVYRFTPGTGQFPTPYSAILKQAGMRTNYEGRADILDNNDVFIEETNRNRLLRVSSTGIRWEYVNGITPTTTGALHWSRYLKRASVATEWMKGLSCN